MYNQTKLIVSGSVTSLQFCFSSHIQVTSAFTEKHDNFVYAKDLLSFFWALQPWEQQCTKQIQDALPATDLPQSCKVAGEGLLRSSEKATSWWGYCQLHRPPVETWKLTNPMFVTYYCHQNQGWVGLECLTSICCSWGRDKQHLLPDRCPTCP